MLIVLIYVICSNAVKVSRSFEAARKLGLNRTSHCLEKLRRKLRALEGAVDEDQRRTRVSYLSAQAADTKTAFEKEQTEMLESLEASKSLDMHIESDAKYNRKITVFQVCACAITAICFGIVAFATQEFLDKRGIIVSGLGLISFLASRAVENLRRPLISGEDWLKYIDATITKIGRDADDYLKHSH